MRSSPEPCLCGATDCVRCYGSRAVTECSACDGEGRVPCAECDGKGCEECAEHVPAGTDECQECGGSGSVSVIESRKRRREEEAEAREDWEREEGR